MSGQRVLVVDDEPQILRALTTNLRGAGYEVDTAATGEAALAAAAMRPPDAVILDLVLPDRSGTEVCRELRTWSSAPVLVLSVVGDEPEKVAALDAGADDYVEKPSASTSCSPGFGLFFGGRPTRASPCSRSGSSSSISTSAPSPWVAVPCR
jgi:CheY-like chemotaxis protein